MELGNLLNRNNYPGLCVVMKFMNALRSKTTLLFFAMCMAFWVLNTFVFQAFCIPVGWAGVLLLVSLAAFFLLPYTGTIRWLEALCSLLNGFFSWICLYCSLYMIEFGLLSFMFFCIALWPLGFIISNGIYLWKTNRIAKAFYLAGLTIPVIVVIIASVTYTSTVAHIHTNNQGTLNIPHTYWGERITGLHFKYGSRICLYDGWRPPLHDPLLVIMLRLHNDPLNTMTLEERINLYRKEFPEYPVRLGCTCNQTRDARGYLSDSVLNP